MDEDRIIEKGRIYFFYRPKVMIEHVENMDQVGHFFLLLSPIQDDTKTTNKQPIHRLLVIGGKTLPDKNKNVGKLWGIVEKTSTNLGEIVNLLRSKHYTTKTKGDRELSPCRPAGEGYYGIISHRGGHTHLIYYLELPEVGHEGEVQEAFNVHREGNFILAVKKPSTPKYPKELQEYFADKSAVYANPTELLDYGGVELFLIDTGNANKENLASIGEEIENLANIDLHQARVVNEKLWNELGISKDTFPSAPMLEGLWE
jgi:hypothetical protein